MEIPPPSPCSPALPHHLDDLGVERLNENATVCGYALHQFVEGCSLDLLALEVGNTIQEVEEDGALLELLAQKIVQL